MMAVDPINTVEGAPCSHCGDDATGVSRVGRADVALCDACYHDQTDACADCGSRQFMTDMYRLSSSDLYCASCAAQHPGVTFGVMQELLVDAREGGR